MVNTCSASKAGAETKNESNATSVNRSENETLNSQCKIKKEETPLLNSESNIQAEQKIRSSDVTIETNNQKISDKHELLEVSFEFGI